MSVLALKPRACSAESRVVSVHSLVVPVSEQRPHETLLAQLDRLLSAVVPSAPSSMLTLGSPGHRLKIDQAVA